MPTEGVLVSVLPELVGDKYQEVYCKELADMSIWAGLMVPLLY